ncbi:M60 family metallopeptidase [Bacteroides thetaiotaomicron]|uniref:M60 family metallopeptidase n=1 Tax=Bacteroides thetaiotaomicron TaxID=818 RepID=UPI00406348A3
MKHIYSYLFLLFLFFLFACSDTEENLIDPYLTVELENNVFNVPIEGKTGTIKIHTNLSDWELVPKISSGYDWCKTSIGLSASDIHLLTFNVAPNEGVGRREAEFVLRGTGVESIPFRVVQLGSEPEILVNIESKLLSKEAQTFTMKVTANVEYTIKNEQKWLILEEKPTIRGMVESDYQYTVTANSGLSVRRDVIHIESIGQDTESIVLEIPVVQESADIDDVIEDDIKVKVESVTMVQGNQYGQQGAKNTIDDDLTTFYSSAKTAESKPIVFDYTLEASVECVDYIMLHQNPIATVRNQLTKGTLYYKSKDMTEWKQCGSFDETSIVPSIRVDVNLQSPVYIRLELERSGQDPSNVSLAEFECYQKSESSNFDLMADAAYFEDNVFSQLKATTTQADIMKITHPMVRAVAQELLDGTYMNEFRARTYQSCKDPAVVGKELTIGKRSICDNPTGLYFEKDKKYIVFVGDEIDGKTLSLYIKDWREGGDNQVVSLKSGLNTIEPNVEGKGYIQYWTDTEVSEPAVKVHVCYGNEIGFWDVRAGHTNEDWKRILNLANICVQRLNVTNAMLDVLGERVQLINTVNAFNTYCPDDIMSIMNMHDELMQIEYMMMGLVKNNAVPRNRMLGVRSWGGSPNWNGTCANFPNSEQAMLDKGVFLQNIWVFGHEFGHGNQVAQMKGAGWAEVTNNIYAQQAMYQMNNAACRLEHTEFKRQGYNDKVVADRFNAYLNDAIVKEKPYLTHEGGFVNDPEKGEYYSADPFVSLAPLWQLSLFFMLTEDAPWSKPDFWPDVHWAAIHDNNSAYTYGEKYVNFMKRAIDASEMNLTDFFKKMGLLREINMKVGDYGPAKQITITKEMVEEIESYGKTKSPVPTPVIYYISGNSLDTYKKQLSVQGVFNQGVSNGNLSKTISHSVWKNVVAFETYAGDELVEICIAGTGSTNNSSTFVRYPEGATCIKAVSWDGKRETVCGTCE